MKNCKLLLKVFVSLVFCMFFMDIKSGVEKKNINQSYAKHLGYVALDGAIKNGVTLATAQIIGLCYSGQSESVWIYPAIITGCCIAGAVGSVATDLVFGQPIHAAHIKEVKRCMLRYGFQGAYIGGGSYAMSQAIKFAQSNNLGSLSVEQLASVLAYTGAAGALGAGACAIFGAGVDLYMINRAAKTTADTDKQATKMLQEYEKRKIEKINV